MINFIQTSYELSILTDVSKLLANCQSGFRPSYSTATCLTEISDYLFDKMDKRYLIGGIFLDLRSLILKRLMLFHTILFLKGLCIMVLKEKNMIGWNPI